MKNCKKCNMLKNFSEFNKDKNKKDGLAAWCLLCRKEYRKHTKLQRSEYSKRKYLENIEYNKIKNAKYRLENKEKIKLLKKNYRKNNKDKIKEYQNKRKKRTNELSKIRLRNNPEKRLRSNISTIVWGAVKNSQNKKRWYSLMGYTLQELKINLESKFTKGMSWDNYGKNGWHLDHIIPRSYFKYNTVDHPAFKACWSLDNLQPLWATTEIAISYGEGPDYIGNLDKNNNIELTDEIKDFLNSVNIVSI